MIGFIWAEDRNHGIGINGQLPWHLPADMKHFKTLTTGHVVVMGKHTFDSIGKPLPNRRNIVLSTTMAPVEGVEIVRNVEALKTLLNSISDDIYIMGGAVVYDSTYQLATHLFKTAIAHEFKTDTKMVPINYDEWELIEQKSFNADDKNQYDYTFETYQKR
ncbi:dihydrofolate reductase [Paucilactobacillus sp. N302-9]